MTAALPEQAPPAPLTMAEKIAAELEANPLAHEWIVAAEIRVDGKTARRASFRGSYRVADTEVGHRIDALETYCRKCRRPLEDVGDQPDCAAKINNEHLIGGDQSERMKRKIPTPVGQIIQQPLASRRDMQYGGYSPQSGR